ncbi:MAG: hypothetical protein LBR29_03075, partial [Methylobacteriaceae bacterium]|nr:hypothetical protein [Methylobacteriaceae bacterium]
MVDLVDQVDWVDLVDEFRHQRHRLTCRTAGEVVTHERSAAIQTLFLSEGLDCFASLAMTAEPCPPCPPSPPCPPDFRVHLPLAVSVHGR